MLDGFGLADFRSIRGELQRVGPLAKVNLLAGPNNAGKSNILQFAQRELAALNGARTGAGISLDRLQGFDIPLGLSNADPKVTLAMTQLRANEAITAAVGEGEIAERLQHVLRSGFLNDDDGLIWFEYDIARSSNNQVVLLMSERQLEIAVTASSPRDKALIGSAASQLTNATGGGKTEDLRRVLQKAVDMVAVVPKIQTIEAFRRIGADDGSDGHSGAGLIEALARLESPTASSMHDRVRFDAIIAFVRSVFDDNSATLQIPHDRSTINISLGGQLLPLESFGTGLHEVVILASAATVIENELVCIEEPEIHLHPILQRQLLAYLAAQTSNQYLIATHSAHMLDAQIASIFRVLRERDSTTVRRASGPRDMATIAGDLGYRASDLVQANSAIWVEGPSDRIYLRHWLHAEAPDLVEGVHFSIMFYGGRLLNHLSAEDPEVDDFISLRRLNRNIAIVIDSDKRSARTRLSATKVRARAEFDRGPGHAWITRGYTIENYVPPSLFRQAVEEVHARATVSWAGDRWSNPLAAGILPNTSASPDKVAIAKRVVNGWHGNMEWPDDLRTQVRRMVGFVRLANR